jgi:two-component system, cell cycle sensor histidine kinase and response regulator CckA
VSESRPKNGEKEMTILVIDDEPTVRRALERLLVRMGYTVLLADSGRAALAAYAERPGGIDYVLLDHTMPDMNGSETFRRLRALDPTARVIVASGYGRNDEIEALLEGGAVGFIQKPFDMKALVAHLPIAAAGPAD